MRIERHWCIEGCKVEVRSTLMVPFVFPCSFEPCLRLAKSRNVQNSKHLRGRCKNSNGLRNQSAPNDNNILHELLRQRHVQYPVLSPTELATYVTSSTGTSISVVPGLHGHCLPVLRQYVCPDTTDHGDKNGDVRSLFDMFKQHASTQHPSKNTTCWPNPIYHDE